MTGKRLAILAAALLVLGGTVVVYARTGFRSGAPAVTDTAAATTAQKQDNSGNYRPTETAPPAPAPPAPTGDVQLAGLDCSLTAQANNDGSISFLFYVQGPGYFTVQQQSSGSWQDLKENVFYAGSGGLDGGSMPAGADGATLRLLKLENGQYTAVSRQFSVSRQEVTAAGGLKSF
ncbi:MAG: hypothetical protein ACYDG7_08390 [Thermoleophilia bacterium]